jgi:hypothetical protein
MTEVQVCIAWCKACCLTGLAAAPVQHGACGCLHGLHGPSRVYASHLDNRADISCSIGLQASKMMNGLQSRNIIRNGVIPD